MNKQNTNKLIKKHRYMFDELFRSRLIKKEQDRLADEFSEAKIEDDEIKIAQIMEEQRQVGSYYPIAFGFECGDGWYKLLDDLMTEIEKIDTEKKVEVHQVKEKSGGLRFYAENTSNEIEDIISRYMDRSYQTCEICGQPGKTNKKGWLRTACKEHERN